MLPYLFNVYLSLLVEKNMRVCRLYILVDLRLGFSNVILVLFVFLKVSQLSRPVPISLA